MKKITVTKKAGSIDQIIIFIIFCFVFKNVAAFALTESNVINIVLFLGTILFLCAFSEHIEKIKATDNDFKEIFIFNNYIEITRYKKQPPLKIQKSDIKAFKIKFWKNKIKRFAINRIKTEKEIEIILNNQTFKSHISETMFTFGNKYKQIMIFAKYFNDIPNLTFDISDDKKLEDKINKAIEKMTFKEE
ncbi:hypothetical protein IJG14_04255 [bacterium]|nr:hypothetical protein [bacterium]